MSGVQKFQLLVVRGYLAAANAALKLLWLALFRRPGRRPAKRILVLRTGAIGDIVVCLPALAYERQRSPGAQLWMLSTVSGSRLSRPGISGTELIAGTEYCDRVVLFTRRGLLSAAARQRMCQELAAYSPDRVLILPYTGEPFSGAVTKLLLLGALRLRVRPDGWQLQNTLRLFARVQHQFDVLPHQVVTALRAAGAGDGLTPVTIRCSLPQYRGDDLPVGIASEAGQGYYLLGVSAKVPHKRWPLEKFVEVAERIAERWEGCPVLLGGRDDYQIAEDFRRRFSRARNACGKLSLRQTVGLARRARFFIGNDSGPAHLAAASGIPTITLFSGIHYPGIWEPWNARGAVVRFRVPCSPCLSEGFCPAGSMACMNGITVHSVLAALESLIAQTGGHGVGTP